MAIEIPNYTAVLDLSPKLNSNKPVQPLTDAGSEIARSASQANQVDTQAPESVTNVTKSQQDAEIQDVSSAAEPQDIKVFVSQINQFIQNIDRSIEFSVAERSGQTVIKVYNSATDELIREIPSEEIQRLAEVIRQQNEARNGQALLLKITV